MSTLSVQFSGFRERAAKFRDFCTGHGDLGGVARLSDRGSPTLAHSRDSVPRGWRRYL